MTTTYNLSSFTDLIPDQGKVKLFRIQEMAPPLWNDLLNDPYNSRAVSQWSKLGISDNDLDTAMDNLSTKKVRTFLFERNYRKITLNPKDRFHFTEAEDSFPMEYTYAMVWAAFIGKKGILPSEQEFVEYWFELNEKSYRYNLSYRWREPGGELGPLTCAAYVKDMLNNYRTFSQIPFEYDEIPEKIHLGAEYRAKKFYAAAMREMCALYELAATDYEELPDPPTIWWHPILDIVFKADAIAMGNGPKARPIPIAIYLASSRSDDNIDRKAQNEHFTEMHEMPIAMRGPKDEVFLPREEDIESTRDALDAGRPKRRSYSAAKKGQLAV